MTPSQSDRLLELLASMDARMDRLEAQLALAQPAIGTVVDSVDGLIAQLQQRGIDIDARLRAILQASERLTRPQTLSDIGQTLDVAEQLPGLTATVVDSIDSLLAKAQQRGIDIDARLQALLRTTERLSRPETLSNIEQTLDIAEQLPGLTAAAIDTIDGLLAKAQGKGIDIDDRLYQLIRAGELLSCPAVVNMLSLMAERGPELERGLAAVLDAGILDDGPTATLTEAVRAVVQTQAQPPARMGALALLRSLWDPDVARAVTFGREVARRFGRSLNP